MVRYGFLFWLAVCFVAALHAQTSTQVTVAQVDNLFAKWNKPDSPGCALAVLQNGRIVYEHGYGMADLEHDALITPATPFHVASISKQFTAAAILLLAEQGKLSLDDDVRKYIPELPDFGVTIRVHHLLRHTSGLPEQWGLLQLAGWRYSTDLITDADVMSLVTRLVSVWKRPFQQQNPDLQRKFKHLAGLWLVATACDSLRLLPEFRHHVEECG